MPDDNNAKKELCPDCKTEMVNFKGVMLRCPKCGKIIKA